MMRSPQPELANDCALRNGRKSRIGICRLDTPVQAGSHPWCRPRRGIPWVWALVVSNHRAPPLMRQT